jgi:hypothetical protein
MALILKRASVSRPSGEWSEDDYDVLADGIVVGRIMKVTAAPKDTPWMWTLAYRSCASGDASAQITDVHTVRLLPRQALRISFRRSHRLHRQIQLGSRHPRKQRCPFR